MRAPIVLTCSKSVNGAGHPCGQPAVALVLVRMVPEKSWDAKPRCAEHDAEWDARMLRKYSVLAEAVVVPL